MGDDKGTGIIIVSAIIFFLLVGLGIGKKVGEIDLCSNQFQGEMHNGKCVKVQREEVK